MHNFHKLKEKFEKLTSSSHGHQEQSGSSSGYPGERASPQQQQHQTKKQQQQQQAPYQYPPWQQQQQQQPMQTAPGSNFYGSGPPNQNYPPGNIGPGGFHIPFDARPSGGPVGFYGYADRPFPGDSYRPTSNTAPYPPPTSNTAPYPPPTSQSPYPPSYPPGNQQVPPSSQQPSVTGAHDEQRSTSHMDSLGSSLKGMAVSNIPPGVPLPLDQHDIHTETENGSAKYIFNGVEGAAENKGMLFLNIKNNELVHQRFLIVYGQVPGVKGNDDRVVIRHPYFPPLTFPAVDGYFKVLAELENGDNGLKFEYLQGQNCICKGELTVKMQPYLDKPPLLLSVIVGKDSKGIFDAPPNDRGPGINDLDAAVRKLRCCAYMWQAFMAEQLYRQGFGRRTFRLEEYYEPDTMACDNANRMTARVHIVKSKLSVAEIRDKELAQQWNPPPGYKRKTEGSMFSVAGDALTDYGTFRGKHYIVCLIADSHWDPALGVILGHGAIGGGGGDRRLGVFGSHTTYTWPANAEEIAAKLLDTTKTDTRYLANDCNECGEHWRAANIGMGAFLHECGHLLTLAHTPSGIMSRGFNDYNRTFMARAPNWDGPVRQQDEAGSHWHRTDIVRLRHHPCLRLPNDPPLKPNELEESGFDVLPLETGVQIQNDNGITMVEVWVNDRYRIHREYTAENLESRRNGSLPAEPKEMATAFPQQIAVDMEKWQQWAGGWADSDKINLVLTSRSTATYTLEDAFALMKQPRDHDTNGNVIFKSNQLGNGEMKGTEKFAARFSAKNIRSSYPKLRAIEIHSGNFIDGVRFVLDDGSKQQVGKCQGGSLFVLPIDPDDDLDHIVVRSGWWIDGVEFITQRGRTSGWKGGMGGSRHVLKPPAGCYWMGLSGSGAGWLDSLTMHYSKST
ncbi:hypothetical protein GGI25_005829 [Coemansia spiralis]|uniref:Jacalin-type lectin domain-containing protein n=1 Tax=Coemansia spiralis TaxID=417178 RepID=A0A9W8FXZ7_9FUNG|nr:hypothetical protein GGI25_005829 [Coemansia spiralis]